MSSRTTHTDARAGTPARDLPEPSLRNTVIAGFVTVAIAFGGFIGWSSVAALESAAIAPGVVIANSHRKTVQHLEGGILRELLVKEGDQVKAGQVLMRLDSLQAEAQLAQLRGQYWVALARVGRLRAEQEGLRQITFPPELEAQKHDPQVRDIMATQQQLFRARWESHDGLVAVQRRRIEQIEEEISALQAQLRATVERLKFTEEELKNVRTLLEKGYERRPRLLELERAAAELRGRRGELQANIARARQAIAAAELEIIGLQNTRSTEIARELQDAQALAAEFADRIRSAKDVLERREIVAPQDGIVVDLKFYTPGGVIGPGQPILDIVPLNDDLVIEARVSPNDIDSVRVGQPAHVRLTAYKQREVPVIDGVLTHVSADQLIDERSGEPYFAARVTLENESLQSLDRVTLYPGMPAEVMIVTGSRVALDYFLSPITHSMQRAFREE